MHLQPKTEFELYEDLLIEHLEAMLRALKKMSVEHWDYTPHQAAPTARTTAVHAWQWLICDRQHIIDPNIDQHSLVAEPPEDKEAFCEAFNQEIQNWKDLLNTLKPEDLDQVRPQFGNAEDTMNVRCYIGHMVQNVIYKHGQLAELFYALEYDGSEPYTAPFPNQIYLETRNSLSLKEADY